LSPRHLVLQAGNLLLQLTHCLLLLCCLCSQLHLQCDLTSLTNNTKGAKFQTPLCIIKYTFTTTSVMLLQYIHGKNDKAHFEMSSWSLHCQWPSAAKVQPGLFLFSFCIVTTMHKMLHTKKLTL